LVSRPRNIAPQQNNRRSCRTPQREQRSEVAVQRDDNSALACGQQEKLFVTRVPQPETRDVNSVMTLGDE
jgi:hypothetical protein